jgi:hypothetical protein
MRTSAMLASLFLVTALYSQDTINVQISPIDLYANELTRGDGDLYGLGSFQIESQIKLSGAEVQINLYMRFEEGAHDFTTIIGQKTTTETLPELLPCLSQRCRIIGPIGSLNNQNIGARGYRNFAGTGHLKSAYVQTDTFGSDVGQIGGQIKFDTLRIVIDPIAVTQSRQGTLPVYVY